MPAEKARKYFGIAAALAVFTIVYNVAEGIVSVYFGIKDEALSLFGFGLDSFVEMISGIGIYLMVGRIRANPLASRAPAEKLALQITGYCFYALTAILAVSALYNIYAGHKPETTFWGIIISSLSIFVMLLLVYGKTYVGKKLGSDPIIADARCTLVCIYMSLTLLAASLVFAVTGFVYADAIGTMLLAWFSFTEGKECFEKVKNNGCCGCEH